MTQNIAPAKALLNKALHLHESGDIDGAEQTYREIINLDYRVTDILPLLAGIATSKGNVEIAKNDWQHLLRLAPDHLIAHIELGNIFARGGDKIQAIEHFRSATRISPDNPTALNNLATTLSDTQQLDEALETFKKLATIQPENLLVHHQIKRLTAAIVPFWHIPMMNDHRRNDAFEAAIVKAVALHGNDAPILDIGSGSGLLSMFAARAGATNIVTCEMVPTVAAVAKEIVAANGFSDSITVLRKASSELEIGQDMSAKADILVSEILSSDLLAENVLGTFEDAHARLLTETATIIPRAASAVGCLVESDILSQYCFVRDVSGFDVSAFAPLAPQRLPAHGSMTGWNRLSPDIELVKIDLKQQQHQPEMELIEIPVTKNGCCAGIIQWLKIDLIEGVEFENHPRDYSDGGWLQIFHPFAEPVMVEAGDTLQIMAGHDRSSLILIPGQALQNALEGHSESTDENSPINKVA